MNRPVAGFIPFSRCGAGTAAQPTAPSTEKAAKARILRLPDTPFRYADELPVHFQSRAVRDLENTPPDNPTTDAGAALGRALFYDTRLSANDTVACASCHHQKHAFSDPGGRFSRGFAGGHSDRNAMPLVEARYYACGRFFWDERARSLEDQVLMPVRNAVEMGSDPTKVAAALAADPAYPELFRKAFGDPKVTPERTARALAQFVRALVSYRSKYDTGVAQVRSRNEDFPNFTREENRGRALFVQRCATCHMPAQQDAVFAGTATQNTGLDADLAVPDLGVADANLDRNRAGHFKTPSLRNVEHTAPYMHDSRFATLEAVVEHYSTGIKAHPNLDGRLRNLPGPPGGGQRTRGFQFTTGEKAALVAFLKTLTDPTFLADPRFADPFAAR